MRNGTYATGAKPLKAVSLKKEAGDVFLVAQVKRLNFPLARVVYFRVIFGLSDCHGRIRRFLPLDIPNLYPVLVFHIPIAG
jgi:hypothetical protein